MTGAPDKFSVLFVCTGNICRSAIAEQVFRARYGSDDVIFSSAGTRALVGSGMPGQAAEISRNHGGEPGAHYGRQLDAQTLHGVDIVIALTREHRSEIVRTLPRANRYTFTLRELARVLESFVADPEVDSITPHPTLAETMRACVPLLAAQRGYAPQPSSPDDDDVVDPYRRSQEIYDQSEAEIMDAVERITLSIAAIRVRS
jgi:protein-tyrosine phosphatase